MNELDRPYHPIADLFPLMTGDEYDQLKADIAANGLLEAIWLHPDGSIIDGRNRHRACLDTNTPPRFRTWSNNGSLTAFVVSMNLHRRHLTSSQRAVIALDVLPMLEAEARERQGARNDLTSVNSLTEVESQQPQRAAEQAADLLQTNRQYVSDAKKIQSEAPDLIPSIRDGTMTINDAKTQLRRQKRVEHIQQVSLGNKDLDTRRRYPVIYADPPWRYEHCKTDNRAVENQYPTMALDDICALPVQDLATPDAVLFLWATSPKLSEALRVIDSWDFDYRTCMVWVKDRIGMGYYARQRHELLLVATRGALPVPQVDDRPDSVIMSPRLAHSEKPAQFRQIIEEMYPEYPKIELFAREQQLGWNTWGNEVSKAEE